MTATAMKPRTRNEFDAARNLIEPSLTQFEEFVIGHSELGERILTAQLARGHVLLEGPPGTAKTRSGKVMSRLLSVDFSRIQFVPDLLPADITGQEVFRPQTGEFVVRKGPIFASLVLGDEINRASPKTQAAMLEAMEERAVTIGDQTIPLPPTFMVVATQNPLEHEGTYPLPEAQLDRFLFKVLVGNTGEFARIDNAPEIDEAESMLDAEDVIRLQELAAKVSVSEAVQSYRSELILASRRQSSIEEGASDRRAKLLLQAAKARALIHGRSYVTAEDVRELVPDALRHVLILRNEAYVEGVSVEMVIAEIIASVPVPKEK